MAGPNTLLSKSHKTESLDERIGLCIGDFGWSQLFQAILISFAAFFDAQQSFISVFTDAEPKWLCNNSNSTCIHNTTSDLCQLPRTAWSWAEPKTTSIISEWDLECAGSITTGLPASCFFLGGLIGGFALATLADSSLGRKNMLVLSSLLMSLTGALTSLLSNNIWAYSCLRFIGGFSRQTIGASALVLSTELVGKKWRGNVGFLNFFCFTLGFLSLALIAFLLKGSSWRLIYLCTCVPSILHSLLVYFLVHESPRWLYIKGRKDEFIETLRSIAQPSNSGILTVQSFFFEDSEFNNFRDPQDVGDIYSGMKTLIENGWALKRLSALMTVGFGVGMMYYGVPLGLGNLSMNLYLSVTLNALFEFPASLLTFFLTERLDRKVSILGLTLLSSLCCICCVLVRWDGIKIGLELVSFCSACTAFDVALMYTLELFPTCVRNSALSVVRQSFLFGAILSPVLAALGRKTGGLVLSYGVFGLSIGVCGMFVLCLPETRGGVSCDTMEEEEKKITSINW